jgi:sporulation protein YlmC with PRC-barrel domain
MKTPESVHSLEGDSLSAKDGTIGKLREFYFDDSTWKVRHAVVEVGSWLAKHEVLIEPRSLGKHDSLHSTVAVSLTKDQVENSPGADTDMPVARQNEAEMQKRFEHGVFFSWGEGFMGSHNFEPPPFAETERHKNTGGKEFDPHLRSTRYTRGSEVRAIDGPIGHVRDFVIDEDSWSITGLVVEFGPLFDLKKVLVPCEWVSEISDEDAIVKLRATSEKVRNAPAVDSHDLEHEIGDGNAAMRG